MGIEVVCGGSMKIGDLVRYKSKSRIGQYGLVIRCIAGTDRRKVVEWMNGVRCSYPERYLEAVCK